MAIGKQLVGKYSAHPDAHSQGIYLVLWFGQDGLIAGRSNKKADGSYRVTTAMQLKGEVESTIPNELKNMIDVFVLDLS
ncbi:hypothetical protein [Pelistega sp. MC2]|uniref:hypothetical protein n=1 Tax=Pelistega sp. MC2 TaxID=1720297 RepID=UPI000B256108|nr:hypothetical protein [Pelistega sp. MC2]